jgi:hypothetical protein
MFVASTVAAMVLYFGLQLALGRSPILVAVPFLHVTQYHARFPLPYLLAVSLTFSLTSAAWLVAVAPRTTRFRPVHIAALPLLSALLAGPLCGMIWVYHDMLAGFFPAPSDALGYMLSGARSGFRLAPIVILYSWRLSIPAYLAGISLLIFMVKRSPSSGTI